MMKDARCGSHPCLRLWPAAEYAEPARATTLDGTCRGPGRGGQERDGLELAEIDMLTAQASGVWREHS
jgi:hypothetical protein